MVTGTNFEAQYGELRLLDRDARRAWLTEHAPPEGRGHWWLALIERAEFDASPLRGRSAGKTREHLAFAVDLIELAIQDGMPRYYALSRLALLAASLVEFGRDVVDPPPALVLENWSQRVVNSFRLSPDEALGAASRYRPRTPDEDMAGEEFEALQEIRWLLPDLKRFSKHLTDGPLMREVEGWLKIMDRVMP